MDIKPFRQFLVARKGLMPVTVKGYAEAVKRITRVIGEHPSDETIESFVNVLYTSEKSYHHKLNTVLALEKYLEFIGRSTRFGRQRKPKPIIKNTLTEAEVTKLIFNCKNERERAIVALFAYSGIRNQELCNLRVRDFLWSQNAIRVIQGKFAKDGISEIPPECSKIVLDYLNLYPRTADDHLFTTLRRKAQMDTRDMRKIIKVVAKRAKMTKRVFPHLLRHSLAANMILRGVDVISLKNQLRHAWLETTLHYANSIVFVERNRYQKFAPSYV
ncbi:MAG: tyrosine-type recombinase/integrase [Candidatus Paceibacterota bacterium]